MEEQLRREKRKERRTGNGRKENRWRQKPTDRGSDSEPKHSQAEKDFGRRRGLRAGDVSDSLSESKSRPHVPFVFFSFSSQPSVL